MAKGDGGSLRNGDARRAAELIERIGRLLDGDLRQEGLHPAQGEALRYLARANRFSRTPAALAAFLGSTRGTVSQTVIALERAGHLSRSLSARDRRSVALDLTASGRALAERGLAALARDIESGGQATALASQLAAALSAARAARGQRPFGACRSCRYFGAAADPAAPYHCMLLDERLSAADAEMICFEQAA